MALSNRERVGRIMESLQVGLGPYILREYRNVFGPGTLGEMDRVLASHSYAGIPREAYDDDAELLRSLDAQAWLKLMVLRWNNVFHDKLGHVGRAHASELYDARNKWAHQARFSNDEARRIADTAVLLLKAVSAGDAAAAVAAIAQDLLRLQFNQQVVRSKRETIAQAETQAQPALLPTQAGLRPWRDVVQPHPDVASGRYIQAEFAADLAQVRAGIAAPEYQDPKEFFRRTYLTEGLLRLLVTGVRRLTAQGGEPVVQLQTAFGGGKTHSMLALYHLCSGQLTLGDIPDGDRLAAEVGEVDLPEAHTAVLVGTALDPTKPREYADCTVRTLWGELAYQLGGCEGHAMVAEADRTGVSPGSTTLRELLFRFGPALIMIDELVAYARNLYGVERLPAGTFDAIMTFMQALTEAVKAVDEALLLISLPESDIEIGGKAGKQVLETMAHVVGRVEAVWKPVSATESFEIVRRRLFASDVDYAARDAAVSAFGDMYRSGSTEFPGGVAERDYLDRMRGAYPIHPELFDRLYQDWSTLERFQRTRGVLRLMAAVIHELWVRGDTSLMILPGSLPLDAMPVRNELLRYLPETWSAVFDIDVDGPESRPLRLDGDVPQLGRFNAARRVARTIFVGSAPTVGGQAVRGLEEVRIRLGCAQPGESTAVFGDALQRLGGQLTYLYTDGSRYWYDTRPTVNKLARDRAQSFKIEVVEAEIVRRLRKLPKSNAFAATHIAPQETGDVVDDDRARIVVLGPGVAHKRTTAQTPAMTRARAFLEGRGSSQRIYKNMLVFLALDDNDGQALQAGVRDYLSWGSIQDEAEALNLDAQQGRQVRNSLSQADTTVDGRLAQAYSWLLIPEQPDPLGPIHIQPRRISGDDNITERAARRLRSDGLLIDHWSPDNLKMELDRYIWSEARGWEVGFKQLWEYLAQYVYLPRLTDHDVLLDAVQDGVSRLIPVLVYATGRDADGYHTGVLQQSSGSLYFDDRSLIVHPAHINERPPEPVVVGGCNDAGGIDVGGGDTIVLPEPGTGGVTPPPPALKPVRYYGRVTVDPKRAQRNLASVADEVIQHFAAQVGCEVEITLEITATLPEGFDDNAIRTVSENSRTLKFDEFGFEEE
jgi:uncharacterized protein